MEAHWGVVRRKLEEELAYLEPIKNRVNQRVLMHRGLFMMEKENIDELEEVLEELKKEYDVSVHK